MPTARTSESHPLRITAMTLGDGRGRIGFSQCPGRIDRYAISGHWKRDLDTDLDAIQHWGATAVVSLITHEELVASGYRADGTRVLLHIGVGNRESYENWKGFLQEMVARGMREPLLIVTDGNPGVLKAIAEVFPRSLKQRCQKHRLENILGKAPKEVRDELKAAILESFHANSYEQGLKKGREVIARYRQRFPSAMKCMEETLEACLQALRLPAAHHKRLRTSNLLERTFGEHKRRTKVIPHFFTEEAAMKLSFAVLLAVANKWRGVRMDVFAARKVEELRNELLPQGTSEESAA